MIFVHCITRRTQNSKCPKVCCEESGQIQLNILPFNLKMLYKRYFIKFLLHLLNYYIVTCTYVSGYVNKLVFTAYVCVQLLSPVASQSVKRYVGLFWYNTGYIYVIWKDILFQCLYVFVFFFTIMWLKYCWCNLKHQSINFLRNNICRFTWDLFILYSQALLRIFEALMNHKLDAPAYPAILAGYE